MGKSVLRLPATVSVFPDVNAGGAHCSGSYAGTYSAVEGAFVGSVNDSGFYSAFFEGFANKGLYLPAELVGHGAVEVDSQPGLPVADGRNLDEDITRFQSAGLCIFYFHEKCFFMVLIRVAKLLPIS